MKRAIIWVTIVAVALGIFWWKYPELSRARARNTDTIAGVITNSIARTASDVGNARSDAPWEDPGQFGDSYGGFTALFTALALCGLCFSAWLQYCQLKEQKLQRDAANAPCIEWDAPVMHVVGLCQKPSGEKGLALLIKLKVCNLGDVSVTNFIAKCVIQDDSGGVVLTTACGALGTTFTSKKNLIEMHFAFSSDKSRCCHLLDALVERRQLKLTVEAYYMNCAGGSFHRKKIYVLDCPDSYAREQLQEMSKRVKNNWSISGIDLSKCVDFVTSLNTIIVEDRDTFTAPVAMGIATRDFLEMGPVMQSEYNHFVKRCKKVVGANELPIANAGVSFALKTSLSLASV